MPSDRAGAIRASIEAFSRNDLDEALRPFDPDVVWVVHTGPEADTYHGHEGVRTYWSRWHEFFEGFGLEIEELREIDEDHVLVRTRGHGTGAGSGAPVDSRPFFQVLRMRDDRVIGVWQHSSEAGALRAAAL